MTGVERELVIRVTRAVAAESVGISITRIVRYERLGLVAPTRVNRQVRYGPLELARLRKLRRLTDDLGVNLAGAQIILRLLDEMERRDGG